LPHYKKATYRGLSFESDVEFNEFMSQHKEGNIVKYKSYTSSSTDRLVAHGFTGSHGVRIKIQGKTGRDIKKYSRNDYENEVLFGRNTKFKVAKVYKTLIILTEQ
jgi:hypothetical protein